VENDESVDILVVEDTNSERASIVEALHSAIQKVCIVAIGNGTEALDYLFGRGARKDRVGQAPPRLILLDLGLPGSDGFAVLGQIRSGEPQDTLTSTPVVVFTDSQAPGDIARCYRSGANSYVLKPQNYPDFQAVVGSIGQYWMARNRTSS